MQAVRGDRIGMIFQEPMTSLNPTLTIGFQIAEVLRLHRGMGAKMARVWSVNVLKQVGIGGAGPPPRAVSAPALRRACASA